MNRICAFVAVTFVAVILSMPRAYSQEAVQGPSGTLRMVVQFPPPSLGLPYSANGMPSSFYWHALFDTLTEWDVDGKLVPALALTWEQRDPLTWTFRLRPNVLFQWRFIRCRGGCFYFELVGGFDARQIHVVGSGSQYGRAGRG